MTRSSVKSSIKLKSKSSRVYRVGLSVLIAATLSSPAFADDLPRRGTIGIALMPSPSGVAIADIVDGSPAVGSGLQPGDIVQSIRGVPIRSPQSLQRALSGMPTDQEVTVEVSRDEDTLSFAVRPVPLPEHTVDDFEAEYDHVTLGNGDRIRTINLFPKVDTLETDQGYPSLFFMGGIPCQPVDGLSNPSGMHNQLFRALLSEGFMVSLVEKPGLGDSEGESCFDGGYNVEIDAYRAAATALRAHGEVDPDRIFAVGISMGGFQVPLIDESADFAGILTWGAGMQPWLDYMVTNFRWRYQLGGQDPDQLDRALRLFRSLQTELMVHEIDVKTLQQQRPDDVAAYEEYYGPIEDGIGRSPKFMREADQANLWSAWNSFDGAYIGLHGEYDWVATVYDHQMIATMLSVNGNNDATFEILPGLDHVGTSHDSLSESFDNRFRGERTSDLNDRTVEWLTSRAKALAQGS